MAYCNRNLTNGKIPSSIARRLVHTDGYGIYTSGMSGRDAEPLDGIEELLSVGLWHEAGHDCSRCEDPGAGRYVIHDYFDYQPSADEVKRVRDEKSEAGKKGAEARWGKAGAIGTAMAPAMAPAITDPVADAMADEWQNDAPNPNPNPNPEVKIAPSPVGDDFAEFWKVYPKKVAKIAAEKAYRRIRKTVSAETILTGATRYAAEQQGQDPKYIKNPDSWLTSGRWEDEPPPARLSVVPGRENWTNADYMRARQLPPGVSPHKAHLYEQA